MRKHWFAWALAVCSYAPCSAVAAQPADRAPTLGGAETLREQLAFIVGTWTIEGMEGAFTETCEWYHNRSHVVCSSESHEPSGVQKGVSVFSYSARTGRYAYYHYGSSGGVKAMDVFLGEGSLMATTEGQVGTDWVREQVTMARRPDGSFDFREEKSLNGGPWKVSTTFHYLSKAALAK